MENNSFTVKGQDAATVMAAYAEFSKNLTEISVPSVTKFDRNTGKCSVVSEAYSSAVKYEVTGENEFRVSAEDSSSAYEAFGRVKAALSQSGRLNSLERVGDNSFNLVINETPEPRQDIIIRSLKS